MSEIEHQGTVAMTATNQISRELLGKIVDEVFDGAIEDASVIEEIYAAIKKHETPAPQDRSRGVTREDAISFLESACRNWSHVPKLSEDDIGDVASELLRFVAKHAATEGSAQ